MRLDLQPMNEENARKVMAWQYAPPYDVYNMDPTRAEQDLAYLVDPANQLYTLHDDQGKLVAFGSFGADARVPGGDYDETAIDIGLGVRPELTGRGLGGIFVSRMVEYARSQLKACCFRVTIAAFNARARRAWGNAGFSEVQHFARQKDGMPFVVLIKRE